MWFGTCMSAIKQLSTILAISFPAPLFAFWEITLVACWPFEARHGKKVRLWLCEAPRAKRGSRNICEQLAFWRAVQMLVFLLLRKR
uniref:Putative secreted protein n=1 Tax=Ixodes ricinus TaxID=34613 RepID=A0A6B0U7S8_IXORI